MKILGLNVGGGVVALGVLFATPPSASAQGILTVTPSRTTTTVAGTGNPSYSGDNGAATSATVALPGAVAYDASGNLFIADTNNHVVREVSPSGTITTIAGTGVEGFGGDGGPATSALLDTPSGIAVDASGNVYIADSHNHRIRKVSGGTITTIAGTGVAGFSGDGATAASAQLALPSGIAVDASGNIYIADTNNHRIREIAGGNIVTVAGDGEEFYAGDGGAATSAALDSPTGVAVSTTGTVYVADRLNQRIRAFSVGGTITTVAGSGGASFAGGFSGDGSNATSATLARPSGVSVDASGNVYIADTDNQRIRQLVNGGAITTVIGSGAAGFGADNGPSTAAILNTPKSVTPDALGNLAIADSLDHRIRNGALPTLSFGSDSVGVPSASQSITLANTGSASITVSSVALNGTFTTVAGGSCSATPITLVPAATCTQNVAFLPTGVGPASGSVVLSGTGVVPQTVLLSGTGAAASTTVQLTTSISPSVAGQPLTLTATVKPAGIGTPTGNVVFTQSGVTLATVPLSSGVAVYQTNALATGTDPILATYQGNTSFSGSASPVLPQVVQDFTLALVPQPNNPAGSVTQTVIPGNSVTFDFSLQPVAGAFSYPITFSTTGFPTGTIITFTPTSVTPNGSPATFTMTLQVPAQVVQNRERKDVELAGVGLALLVLPLAFVCGRRRLRARIAGVFMVLLLSVGSIGGLSGCGSHDGFFGYPPGTYNLSVIATGTEPGGYTIQHNVSATVIVQ
jgi:sugar lactone lactonase YvrE